MSNTALPISPDRFRSALADLPVSSLHEKAAEIRNSQKYLCESNVQLREFAEAGDRDCAEAIVENEALLETMEERLRMLKEEIEGRGLIWVEGSVGNVNGHSTDRATEDTGEELEGRNTAHGLEHLPDQSGRFTDEELARRLAEQMEQEQEQEQGNDGVHL